MRAIRMKDKNQELIFLDQAKQLLMEVKDIVSLKTTTTLKVTL